MKAVASARLLAALALSATLAACATMGHEGPTLNSQARLRVAQAAEQSGDYALADSMYAEAAAQDPTSASAQLQYANALLREGKVAEARELLTRRMTSVSDRRELEAGLAAMDVLTGDAASALTAYNELLAARPGDLSWTVDKAVALDLLGRHEEAQPLYRRALRALPNDPVVTTDLALSLALSGKTAAARALVTPLRDAANLSPRVQNNIDVVLAASGRAGEASGDGGDGGIQKLAQALGGSIESGPARSP